jgi:glycosyltransferase involved in cell wall biosynthesis
LRLLFLGRVEDTAKGVLWIPKILSRILAKGTAVRLTVAGDGPDLPALRKALSGPGLHPAVDFVGLIPLADVPGLVARHDVFLMPSRFEGFPLTLIEAMAGGCVPVASRIRGVTDFVVEDGRTGLLFPVGAVGAAADWIVRLDRDRSLLASLSRAARDAVASKFTASEQASRYAELLHRVMESPQPLPKPLPLERWQVHRGLLPGWWSRLPLPLKNALRVVRERLR